MKKIVIDITAFVDQYKDRGIGNYARYVVTRIVKNKDFEWHVIGFGAKEDYPDLKNVEFRSLGPIRLSTPFNSILFKTKFIPIIKSIAPDLYFAPHFERGLPIGICKAAVMMHDVIPLITKKYSSRGSIANFLKGLFYKCNIAQAKKCDLILTNSNFSKQELIKVGFDRNKIQVTYSGKKANFVPQEKSKIEILKKYRISKPYILYYGGLDPNKNIPQLLEAFNIVRKKKNILLVLADKSLFKKNNEIIAQSPDAEKIKQQIIRLNISNAIVLPKFIEDEDLATILKQAEAFIHLSSYEGFGLSVIEAMSVGTPTIAANRSCYPEVLGSAALLVNPDNPEEVANKIIEVVNNPQLRQEFSQKGIKQSQKYSWENTAEETLEAFSNIL